MAGGTTPKRGMTLAERSALTGSGAGGVGGTDGAGSSRGSGGAGSTGTGGGGAGGATATAGSPDAGGGAPRPAGRHCWVRDPPGAPGRWPGVLVEWLLTEWRPGGATGAGGAPGGPADRPTDRLIGRAWLGRVVYAVDDGARCVLVETWLPAGQLEPVDGVPAPSTRGSRTTR